MPKQPSTDESGLVEAFVRGEAEAIEVIDGWIDAALREGFQSLRDDWDDLRQEIRLSVFRILNDGRFLGRSSLRTYVHRVARNVGIDSARLAYRHHEAPSGSVNDRVASAGRGNVDDDIAARDLVRKVLTALPEADRVLVLLVFRDHCSYAEVARVLGTTEGAIKSRMSRCKSRILNSHGRPGK